MSTLGGNEWDSSAYYGAGVIYDRDSPTLRSNLNVNNESSQFWNRVLFSAIMFIVITIAFGTMYAYVSHIFRTQS